jgi:hypothetical protein
VLGKTHATDRPRCRRAWTSWGVRRMTGQTPKGLARHGDEGFVLGRGVGARCWGREAPVGKRQAVVVGHEDEGKAAVPAMAGAAGREASAGTRRKEWEAAARALAGAVPSWGLRLPAGEGRRGRGCSSTHLATSETEDRCVSPSADWYRRVGCQPGERLGPAAIDGLGRGEDGGKRGGGRGPGQGTRGLPNLSHRRRDWGGWRWGQAAQGQRRDPRKGREDRESDRGCQRREWHQCAGQRQCDCDNDI